VLPLALPPPPAGCTCCAGAVAGANRQLQAGADLPPPGGWARWACGRSIKYEPAADGGSPGDLQPAGRPERIGRRPPPPPAAPQPRAPRRLAAAATSCPAVHFRRIMPAPAAGSLVAN